MKIGMVLKRSFPPDIRVEKEAAALVAAGLEVHLLAYSRGGQEPLVEDRTGLHVHRIPREARRLSRPALLGNALCFSFAFHDGYWAGQIERFAREQAVDVLHVHDLPLVGSAVAVGERLGLPVVADLHENMPAALQIGRASVSLPRRLALAVFRNEHLWRRYERRILPHCARVVVVVPEAAERLAYLGPERVVLVSNTEDETTFQLGQPDPEILARYAGTWVASYVGGIGWHRGVDTAIRAMPLAAAEIPHLRLVIVGVRGEEEQRLLNRFVRQAHAEAYVEVIGWQPFDKVNSFVAASAVCLVPHNDCEHTQTTIPHKLFQAMLAGKPVVVSDVRPLRRVVEESASGVVFAAGRPESLARALVRLYRDPALAQQLGQNGRQAASGPYAWRHDARRLVEMYRGLAPELPGAQR
ncbi:MAG: glycosyltransferase family 4 protein [Anaerolineae bacterium]|nr:glycosyltransferase family 4 protein [Anaerolineae bacterium]